VAMLITITRNPVTQAVDCIKLCPESLEETSLLNLVNENKINLKKGLFLLLKEDRIRDRKVEQTDNDVWRHT
jgi:hypothetical protein